MAYRYEDYRSEPGDTPWLDRPDATQTIDARLAAGDLSSEDAAWLHGWVANGYVIFRGLLPTELAQRIASDVQQIYEENKHLPIGELKEHFKNAYPRSTAMCEAMVLPEVLRRLDLIFGRRALPHQTLSLPVSTQQAAHSDQILMTTHPMGYMLAAWFALETIDEECGPLLVYPGSHRLSYVCAEEVGIPYGASEQESGSVYDANYYRMIDERLADSGIEPKPFIPEQGDVLLWHSNLLHAAATIERAGATRMSLIAHYFGEDTLHYSDLFGWKCISPDLRKA